MFTLAAYACVDWELHHWRNKMAISWIITPCLGFFHASYHLWNNHNSTEISVSWSTRKRKLNISFSFTFAGVYFTSAHYSAFLVLTLVLIPKMRTRFYSVERADKYKPVAFLVLFVVPLCSSAHFPAILSLLGWTVRTEQHIWDHYSTA